MTHPRHAATLTLALAALCTFVACTGSPATSPSASGGGVVSSGPLTPSGGAPTAPNPMTPEPVRDAHKQAFTKAEPVPGSTVVQVEGMLVPGPPCSVIGRVDVAESDSQVTITVWAGARADAKCDGPQAAIQYPFVVDVTLRQPLSGRTVIDGAR